MMIETLKMKRIIFSLGIAFLLPVLFAVSTLAQSLNHGEAPKDQTIIFDRANRYYEKGDFAQAAAAYHRLLDSGYESGNLYYNLGNAYFKMGHTGMAVLYYEKARRLIPGDHDLKANLALALTGVNEGKINWSQVFLRSLANLAPLDQLSLTSSACFFLFILLIIFGLLAPAKIKGENYGKIKKWYRRFIILTGCFLLLLIFLTSLAYLDRYQAKAVATKDGAQVFSEPGSGGTVYYQLAEGTRLIVNRTKDGWCLIKRQDGKRGWVKQQYLGRI